MEKPMEQLVFSYQDISEKLGKSRSTIARWVRKQPIPTTPPDRTPCGRLATAGYRPVDRRPAV